MRRTRDLQRQHILVQVRIADTLPAVLADPVLVEQVLINLVRNAADALSGVTNPQVQVVVGLARLGWVNSAALLEVLQPDERLAAVRLIIV